MLHGLTALDLTTVQGQFAGRVLADLGMRVIKVEPPGGDAVRGVGPFAGDVPGRERSLRFAFLNGGKESVTLDLETADGRELLLGLVENCDVLLESFAPGRLAGLGLGWEALHERNPRLVMASLSGFGQEAPARRVRGARHRGRRDGRAHGHLGRPGAPTRAAARDAGLLLRERLRRLRGAARALGAR